MSLMQGLQDRLAAPNLRIMVAALLGRSYLAIPSPLTSSSVHFSCSQARGTDSAALESSRYDLLFSHLDSSWPLAPTRPA